MCWKTVLEIKVKPPYAFDKVTTCFEPNRTSLRTIGVVALYIVMLPSWFSSLTPPALAQQVVNDIYTLAGGGSNAGLTGTSSDLPGPTAAIEDASGNFYIAPPLSRYVYKLSSGKMTVFAGTGWGGFNSNKLIAAQTPVGAVSGLVIDAKGNIFLADYGNSRIREVTPDGKIKTVAGSTDKCAHSRTCSDGGLATSAFLNLPVGIALDAAGNLYIADSYDNRIRAVNMQTAPVTIAGVTIQPGYIDTIAGSLGDSGSCSNIALGCGNGGPALKAQLTLPQGVAVDTAGNIYIADTNDNMVREIAIENNPNNNINFFAGTGHACHPATSNCGDGPAASASVSLPAGVGLDKSGNVYIADSHDHKIRVVNTQSGDVTFYGVTIHSGNIGTIAGTGVQAFSGDNGTARAAALDLPGGVFVDATGNLLISDTGNQRVREVNSAGTINTIAGGGLGDGPGAGAATVFAGPFNLTRDPAGNIYVADQGNNRIRKVDTSYNVSTFVGTGSAGSTNGSVPFATFSSPSAVTYDPVNASWYIADSNNFVIRKVDSLGNVTTVAGSGQTCYPISGSCGDNGPATAANFAYPINVVTDSAGNLFIADYFGCRVRAVNMQSSTTSLGGIGNIPQGYVVTIAGTTINGNTCGKASDGTGRGIGTELDHPAGLAVDGSGDVFISDQYNMIVRRLDTTNAITTYALNGNAKLSGNGGLATAGSMWDPLMIALDGSGNLFISGGNDDVVQLVDAATQHYGTVAGNPNNANLGGYNGDGIPATTATMSNVGIVLDSKDVLYIADNGNNRLRDVPLSPTLTVPTTSLTFGIWPIGQTSNAQQITLKGGGGLGTNISYSFSGKNPLDFSVGGCSAISPYATCAASVTFTPTDYGPRSATLLVSGSDPSSPHQVPVSGSGPDYTVAANPTQLTIQKGQQGTSTLTLTPEAQFNQQVSFLCTVPPGSNLQCTHPQPVLLNQVLTEPVTIGTQQTTPSGTYNVTVSVKYSAQLFHTVTLTVIVP
jgi:sugar lactone lactonase YvrE